MQRRFRCSLSPQSRLRLVTRVGSVREPAYRHGASACNTEIDWQLRHCKPRKSEQSREQQQSEHAEPAAIVEMDHTTRASAARGAEAGGEANVIAYFDALAPLGEIASVQENPLPISVNPATALAVIPFDDAADEAWDHWPAMQNTMSISPPEIA